MENTNPKTNPITTILGYLFILLGLLIYALPIFIEVKKDFTDTWYIPLIVIAVGTVLVFSPDTIVTGAKGVITNYTKEKTTITKETTTEVKPEEPK